MPCLFSYILLDLRDKKKLRDVKIMYCREETGWITGYRMTIFHLGSQIVCPYRYVDENCRVRMAYIYAQHVIFLRAF
jgi:hypothetical protein